MKKKAILTQNETPYSGRSAGEASIFNKLTQFRLLQEIQHLRTQVDTVICNRFTKASYLSVHITF